MRRLPRLVRRWQRSPATILTPAVRRIAWSHPRLYWAYARLRFRRSDPFTELADEPLLCVEGYPRSANRFFHACVAQAFPGRPIVSYFHAPVPVLAAMEAGVPTVVLVRPPLDAVASYVVRTGNSEYNALRFYAEFHRRLLPVLDRLFVVPFSVAVNTPVDALERFASAHDLPLADGLDNQTVRERADERIEAAYRRRYSTIDPLRISRPDARRSDVLAQSGQAIRGNRRLERLRAEAEQLHSQFMGRAAEIGLGR